MYENPLVVRADRYPPASPEDALGRAMDRWIDALAGRAPVQSQSLDGRRFYKSRAGASSDATFALYPLLEGRGEVRHRGLIFTTDKYRTIRAIIDTEATLPDEVNP